VAGGVRAEDGESYKLDVDRRDSGFLGGTEYYYFLNLYSVQLAADFWGDFILSRVHRADRALYAI